MQRAFKPKPRVKRSNKTSNGGVVSLSGSKFIPSDDPPVLTGQPWNSIIIDTNFSVPVGNWTYFKFDDLYKCLINQCGFNNANNIQFEVRFLNLAIWAAEQSQNTNMTYARLCVMPMDVFNNNQIELTRLESNCVRNKFAKVGYNYPLNISSLPLVVNSETKTVIVSCQTSVQCMAILHLKILWRGAKSGFKVGLLVDRFIPFVPWHDRSSEHEQDDEEPEMIGDTSSNN